MLYSNSLELFSFCYDILKSRINLYSVQLKQYMYTNTYMGIYMHLYICVYIYTNTYRKNPRTINKEENDYMKAHQNVNKAIKWRIVFLFIF